MKVDSFVHHWHPAIKAFQMCAAVLPLCATDALQLSRRAPYKVAYMQRMVRTCDVIHTMARGGKAGQCCALCGEEVCRGVMKCAVS